AKVEQFLKLDPKPAPGAAPIGVKLAIAVVASVNRLKPERTLLAVSPWSDELHIGVICGDNDVDVFTIERCEAGLNRSSQECLAQTGLRRQARERPLPEGQEPRIPQCQSLGEGSVGTPPRRDLLAHRLHILLRHRPGRDRVRMALETSGVARIGSVSPTDG